MARQKHINYDDFIESGNWNLADYYSKLKIGRHLVEIDNLIELAAFGTNDLVQEFIIDEPTKQIARIHALERLHKKLSLVVNNTLFAIKKKEDKIKLKYYSSVIEKISPLLAHTKKKKIIHSYSGRSESIVINEKIFSRVLLILERVHRDVLDILNKSDLIFASMEDFDPEKLKNEFHRQFIEEG